MRTLLSVLLSTCLLSAASAGDISVTLGTTISGSLVEPGALDRYTFAGVPGQRLVFDSLLAESGQINVSLISPSGRIVWTRNAQSDVEPMSIAEAGTYVLLVDGSGPATGAYSFRLLDVATQPVFPLDTILTDTLSPGNSVRIYQLDGTAGQRFYFDGLGANVGGTWYLYGPANFVPSGSYLAYAGIGADFEITFPQTGAYALILYGTSTTPLLYSVQGVSSSVNLHSLSLGPTVAGAIANAGDQEVYTFAGTPGQRVLYDAQDADNLPINARLLTPSGLTLWERNSDADVEPVTLVEAGTYSLVIDGTGSATGPYKFRLLDAAKASILVRDTIISDTLSPGISAKPYRFEGVAGEHLFLDGLGANAGGNWYLYGPGNFSVNGSYLATCGIGADFEVTLPLDGNYLLVAWGSNAGGPLPFSFQVITSDLLPGTLVLGSTITGNLAEIGEQHLYTFAASAGQRIFYDSLDSDPDQIYSRLTAPSGAVVWDSTQQSADITPVTLVENGIYTLQIDGNAAAIGDFRFRILDLAAAAPLVLGGTTTGSLSPANSTTAYQVSGIAGQRLNFENLTATLNQAYWRLIGPANQNVTAQANITTDIGDVVLPVTGIYHLLVEGFSDNAAPLQYQFIASNKSDAPVAVSGLGVVRSGTIAVGQQDTNTFTAPAGLWVYFDSQDRSSPGSIYAELRDPLDAVVFTINAYLDSGPYVLPRSGTYKLILKGSSAAATGTYAYRLLDLVSGIPALPLNATLSGNLDPAYRTDVYQFTGQAGQRLLYDALQNDFAAVTVRLLLPDGQARYLNGNSDSDVAPFTLPLTGTYRLFFESSVATPVSYAARLLDIDAQPLLVFDALVSLTLDPGLGVQVYRFEGTPGQRLYFDGVPSNTGAVWYLYGPKSNEQLAGTSLNGDFEWVTSTPGRYALVIYGSSAVPVPATFEVFTPGSGTPVDGLRITSIAVTGAGTALVWDSKPGLKYRVQYKTSLNAPGWTELPGDVTASGASSTKSDTTTGANSARFYQVTTVP